jgi:hypothetical protein
MIVKAIAATAAISALAGSALIAACLYAAHVTYGSDVEYSWEEDDWDDIHALVGTPVPYPIGTALDQAIDEIDWSYEEDW